MKINVILADIGAQDASGKLNLLGAGWSQISVLPSGRTSDFAVAVLMEAPWDKCNREIELVMELHDEDGKPVMIPGPVDPQPLRISQQIIVPTIPGSPNGSPGTANMLMNLQGGLALYPGASYRWVLTIDGERDDAWTAGFFVQRQPAAPTIGGGIPKES